MKRQTLILALALGTILSVLPMRAQVKAHRVLFAVTSPDEADWQLTANTVRNLISGLGPEPVEIEIYAFSPGIAFLKKEGPDANEIAKLQSPHVFLVARGNTMQKQNINASYLVAGSKVVPAGIAELVRKREQGWTYIKAGR
jgi:intracellular sulfur oxidation DsrE/DsrF family protein